MAAHDLPLIAQRFINQPLCIHPSRAVMLVAALNSRLGVNFLQVGDKTMSRQEMNVHAEAGKVEARVGSDRRSGNKIFEQVNGIAIIPVQGTLVNQWGLDPYSGMTGYDGIEAKILATNNDPDIKARVMIYESGGGDVTGLFDTVELIEASNARNGGKPIFAIFTDYAYSAAYALASACDKIWLPKTGGAGSIGVITLHADYSESLANDGVKVTVMRAGAEKARAHPVEPLPDHTKAHIEGQLEEIREIFVDTVARNRKLSARLVRSTEGQDYMGRHAVELGLANAIASKHQAFSAILKKYG